MDGKVPSIDRIPGLLGRTILLILVALIGLLGFCLVTQLLKDARRERLIRLVTERLTEAGPHLKGVGVGGSNWANRHGTLATTFDRAWNRMYPAIVGSVKTPADRLQVMTIVRACCDEQGYDKRLILFAVKLESEEMPDHVEGEE